MYNAQLWAVSSAVEHCLHTAGVTSSKLVPPTRYETPQVYDLRGFLLPVARSAKIAIHIKPALVLAHETTGLVQAVRAAALLAARHEFDGGVIWVLLRV